jgi:hypothetical protein
MMSHSLWTSSGLGEKVRVTVVLLSGRNEVFVNPAPVGVPVNETGERSRWRAQVRVTRQEGAGTKGQD